MDPSAIMDPATGRPLPPDAIVRILHITNKVHVYSLPRDAVSTTAGYAAASWTTDPRNHIFTARLRVLETSFTSSPSQPTNASEPPQQQTQDQPQDPEDTDDAPQQLKVDILLEDPSAGTLFAAAPYTATAAVEPTTDSSRFFALRVRDPASGHKATLGVGFEERSEAFDFGVALQEAGRALGWAPPGAGAGTGVSGAGAVAAGSGAGGGNLLGGLGAGEEKRDLSLKEGETITVNLAGTRFGRRAGRSDSQGEKKEGEGGQSLSSFALPPPPPPSAREVRAQKRLSAQQLGFDDGQFGEFA